MKKILNANTKMNLNKQKKRQSNIELLRIICILMIIFSHAAQYLYGGSWWEEYQTSFSFNFLISLVLGIWGQLSVITFIVISSYFQVESKKIHSKKLVMLIVQTIVLTFFSHCLSFVLKTQDFSIIAFISRLFQSIRAPFTGTYWFITTYLFFYILSPLMQFITEKVSQESLKHICIFLMIGIFGLAFFVKSPGGTLLEFCSLYFIVVYLKKYKEKEMKQTCKKNFLFSFIIIFSCCIGLNLLSTILDKQIFCKQMYRIFVHWNPLLIMTSIYLFYVFKYHVSIKSIHLSNFICNLSKTSIGVYILHENSIWGRVNLWNKRFHLEYLFKTNSLFIFYYIGSILLVFIICTMVEFIREKLFDEYLFTRHFKKLDNLCHKIDDYYLCTDDKISKQ